jgi:hypothetical protein
VFCQQIHEFLAKKKFVPNHAPLSALPNSLPAVQSASKSPKGGTIFKLMKFKSGIIFTKLIMNFRWNMWLSKKDNRIIFSPLAITPLTESQNAK